MKKKHKFGRYIVLVLFVIFTATLAVLPFLADSANKAKDVASLLSAKAERRDISRLIAGGGSIENTDEYTIVVPEGVELEEYYVSDGDVIKAGDKIAKTDRVSVMSAVTRVQESIEHIEEEINKLDVKTALLFVNEEGKICVNTEELDSSEYEKYSEYLSLCDEAREYSILMQELFKLYNSGYVVSDYDGMITELDDSLIELAVTDDTAKYTMLINAPNGNDETAYMNFVGVVANASESGYSLKINPSMLQIEDYMNPGNIDTSYMNMTADFTAPVTTPVYEIKDGAWSVCENLKPGDFVILACDQSGIVWAIKLDNGTGGDMPDVPGGFDIDMEAYMKQYMKKYMSGFSFGYQMPEEEYEYFSKDTVDICKLIPLEKFSIEIEVDEREISEVSVGMDAVVMLDAFSGQKYSGVVTDVSQTAENSGGNSKFAVNIEIDYAEGMLIGMNASVLITVDTKEDVLVVPVRAITDEGSRSYIYKGYDEKKELLTGRTEVKLGASDAEGEFVEILEGIAEGDEIFYKYYDTLEISRKA